LLRENPRCLKTANQTPGQHKRKRVDPAKEKTEDTKVKSKHEKAETEQENAWLQEEIARHLYT
jgi:hypothetical protein